MNLSDCYYLGYISKGNSNSGRATIKLDTDQPENYKELESVLIQMTSSDQTPVPFFIKKVLTLKGRELIIELDLQNQLPDTTFIKGKSVYLPLDKLPELGENSFYYHEVIGFNVIDENRGSIGLVSDVYESAAHPVLAIDKNNKEILIPLTDEVLKKVNKKDKEILLSAPDGLIDLYLD